MWNISHEQLVIKENIQVTFKVGIKQRNRWQDTGKMWLVGTSVHASLECPHELLEIESLQ